MKMTFAWARRFMQSLVAPLPVVFAVLLVVWAVTSPWIILLYGGWRLLLRWCLLQYPFALLGFAVIMALVNRRELLVRVRNWRAARKSKELRETAPDVPS
jgi:hypothetical protein